MWLWSLFELSVVSSYNPETCMMCLDVAPQDLCTFMFLKTGFVSLTTKAKVPLPFLSVIDSIQWVNFMWLSQHNDSDLFWPFFFSVSDPDSVRNHACWMGSVKQMFCWTKIWRLLEYNEKMKPIHAGEDCINIHSQHNAWHVLANEYNSAVWVNPSTSVPVGGHVLKAIAEVIPTGKVWIVVEPAWLNYIKA